MQAETIDVWILDDDSDFCQYLQNILENDSRYRVIGMSNSLQQAYEDLANAKPQLVTVDLSLPDGSGVELVKWLEKHMPDVKKIVISFWGQENIVYEAIVNGADGYLQKDHMLTMEMSKAIDTLESGGTPISPGLAKYFLKHFTENSALKSHQQSELPVHANQNLKQEILNISKREVDVLELLVQGLSYNEIADELNVSYHTVSSHIKKIYKKLNVNSKVEAIATVNKQELF